MGINLSELEPPLVQKKRDAIIWRRQPTRAVLGVKRDSSDLALTIDEYCRREFDEGNNPTLCDLAGAIGFDSVTQMVNHARRNGGETMRAIARGILVVSAGYEEEAQMGNRAAAQLLALMPEFDSEEPAEQNPQRPFMPQRDINLNITGVTRSENNGAQLTEQEAYLKLIKYKTYEEVAAATLETEQSEDGDFRVLTLDEESE